MKVSLRMAFTMASFSNVKPLYEDSLSKQMVEMDHQHNDVRENRTGIG